MLLLFTSFSVIQHFSYLSERSYLALFNLHFQIIIKNSPALPVPVRTPAVQGGKSLLMIKLWKNISTLKVRSVTAYITISTGKNIFSDSMIVAVHFWMKIICVIFIQKQGRKCSAKHAEIIPDILKNLRGYARFPCHFPARKPQGSFCLRKIK